jgi:hypothetical protein
MAGQETAQPLLSDQDLLSAWDRQDVETESESTRRISNACTVEQMFEEHLHDILKFLQTRSVEKLAEFTAEVRVKRKISPSFSSSSGKHFQLIPLLQDGMVFGAFNDDAILTFGSDQRWLNKEETETAWRRHLQAICKNRGIALFSSSSSSFSQRQRGFTSRKGWYKPVAVEAYVVTIKYAAAPVERGLLHPLIQQWQSKRCSYSVFTLPAVQSVIQYKWKTFARRLLFLELSIYLIWLTSYYIFCAALQDEDLSLPLPDLLLSARGRLTVAAETVSVLAMTPFLLLELGSMYVYGFGWLNDPTNALDTCTYILQVAITVLHFGRIWLASNWLTYCLAVQCILLMFRLQYFTQVLRPTRFSFSTVVREVVLEVGWVFIFIFLVCIAYGAAFHISFRTQDDEKTPEEFISFVRAVLASLEHLYGDLKLSDFINSDNPVFNTCLALSFILIMGYCLINLLIGMIINSLDRVLDHEGAKQLCNQARLINEMETVIPKWFEEKKKKEWHPRYVHVLRIDPNKLDAIEIDKLWSKHGEFAPVMQQTSGGGGGDLSEERDEGEIGEENEGREGGENKDESNAGGSSDTKSRSSALMSKLEAVEEALERQWAVLEQLEAKLVQGSQISGQNLDVER